MKMGYPEHACPKPFPGVLSTNLKSMSWWKGRMQIFWPAQPTA